MNGVPPPGPPFLDWRLDAWKVALLVLLFVLLVAWALWADAPAHSQSLLKVVYEWRAYSA